MPKNTNKQDEQAFLKEARERALFAQEYWQTNYEIAKEDIAFHAGTNHWPSDVAKDRAAKGRPMLTLNNIPQYVEQVLGDQRQNTPSIQLSAVGADSDIKLANTTGNKDYTLAEVNEGLIRNIEYTSKAKMHYTRAFNHAVESGIGWLRLINKYSRDDQFEQDLVIKSVKNRFAVLIDPRAVEPDYSDANYAFISEDISRKEYDRKYPSKPIGDVSSPEFESWFTDDSVRVSEYFYRKPENRTLLLLTDGRAVWEDEVKDVLDELEEQDILVQRTRKVETMRVYWAKITAHAILDKEISWGGSTIPLAPVFGKEITVDKKPIYVSLFYHGKDAQRMHNFWMTAATERVALAPKAPYKGTAEAIEGYEDEWRTANTENHSILRYNAGQEPPKREAAPQMPVAEIQLAMTAVDEIKNTIGMHDASIGQAGNETSGKAILARQRQGDRGNFVFIDNRDMAIEKIAKCALEVIPYFYDSERVIRVRGVDGAGDWVKINQMVIDEETQKPVMVHDISAIKFDAVVNSGPSYQTQRMEASDSLMQFVQAMPASGAIISDLIADNMDWPQAKEIAKRLKKTIPPEMLDDAGEEGEEPKEPTPAEQKQLAMQKEQMEMQKNQQLIDSAKNEAEIKTAEAKIAEANFKIIEVQAKEEEAIIRVVVKDTVSEMIEDIRGAALIAGNDSDEQLISQLVNETLIELTNTPVNGEQSA